MSTLETGTVPNVVAASSIRIYPQQPLFIVLWTPLVQADDYEDRARIYGVYADEGESKSVFERLIHAKTDLNVRGSFCWIRTENINHGPAAEDLAIDFGLESEP